MVTAPSCHDGQQTGKLPDKALIITWAAFPCNNPVLWCFVRVKTSEPSLRGQWWQWSGWHLVSMNPRASSLALRPVLMPGGCVSLASLESWWWRKLNHLLIEDDKEPTHLCYPQWSHQPHNDNRTISEQSAKHRPAVSLHLSMDNEISTHAVSISNKKLSQENDLTWKDSFHSLAEHFSHSDVELILIIAFICLSAALWCSCPCYRFYRRHDVRRG